MRKKSACLFPELVKGSATYEKDIHPYRTIGARNRSFGDRLQPVVGYEYDGHQHNEHGHNYEQVGHPTIWECRLQSRAGVTYAWLFYFACEKLELRSGVRGAGGM